METGQSGGVSRTMDDLVIRGMAKWPNVPAVYGWLTLDRRGAWLIKSEKISNPTVNAFIGRNYAHDQRGRWYFQNGPQRVYVTLEYTPFVYRLDAGIDRVLDLEAHNGQRARAIAAAFIDEGGAVLLQTDIGIGIVHDKDLEIVRKALVDFDGSRLRDDELGKRVHAMQRAEEAALYLHLGRARQPVVVQAIRSVDVPRRFGFDANPCDDTTDAAARSANV